MSAWLVELISGLGGKIFDGVLAWWDRRQREIREKQAEELAERMVEIRQEAERQQAMLNAARAHTPFSYNNWEASP